MVYKFYMSINQKEETHLAKSRNTEGALCPLLFDKNNKLCGMLELLEINPIGFVLIGGVIGVVGTKVYPPVKKYVSEKTVPAVKKFWNNKIKKKKTDTLKVNQVITDNSYEESVHQKYRKNMSNDEAKKELVEALVLQMISEKKTERVVKTDIVDENKQKANTQALINEITNPALISEIHSILSDNPHLITQQQATIKC
ncbi:MAG: hypothetical protein K2L10_02020 [Ruminococcus sp.]|nr:hypothetical protein [Ruminococcus sp.]